MTYAEYGLFALGVVVGFLILRNLAWLRLEKPTSEQFHAMLKRPDEKPMPPRTNRRIY
jgi:hypothetical protein